MNSWTVADGIPIGPVYAMVQDHEGFLWLGTTNGIVRFDGARFTRWDAIHSTPLPRADVRALSFARDGTLWVGFDRADGTVTVAALRNGEVLSVSKGTPPHESVTSVVEDHAGSVWAVSDGALYRLRLGSWDVIRNSALAHEVVSVREDSRSNLWIGTRQGVFRTRDGESFELVAEGIARETSESPDGALWMTDPAHGVRRHGARAPLTGIDGWGTRLLHDTRGNLWVATTGQGLWRIRATTGDASLIEMATMQTGLSSNAVQSLLEDRDGNIWVGTTLGLHSLTPQQLTPLASGTLVRAVLPDSDGSVWVGTASGLVQFRHEGGGWSGRRLGATSDIRSLFRDASGVVRTGSDEGSSCSAGAPPSAPRMTVVRPVIAASAADTSVWRPVCGAREVVWAATGAGSVTLRRGDQTIATIPRAPASAAGSYSVDAMFEDADDSIWVGGTGGLWRIRAGEAQHVGERDGLPAQRVMAIAQSDDGFLWLVTDRGPLYAGRRAALVRFRPADFERAAGSNQPFSGYAIYDASNGLAGVPLGSAAAARSTDGSLWFAIGGNLTVVDPKQLARERAHAETPARIIGVTVDDRSMAPSGTSLVPAGARKLQIDYTAIRLSSPRQTRFRYRLDGFDREWVDAGGRRQAYYTNLAPGQYVFRVQANDNSGAWSGAEAQWPFTLQPAFRQTGWFYGLCGVGILLAAWGGAQTRVWILNRQFAATLAERTRLSREVHDTMLQSLVGIALQVQAIARRCGPHASEQQSQLVALRRQVEQYIREARQAVLDLRSPMLEVGDLATALAEIGRRIESGSARVEVSTNAIDALAPAAEGELLRIGQEAMTNAARHAGASHIHVDLRQESDQVLLRVTDDGRGFDVDAMLSAAAGHYGLTGMRERAARVGGRLTVRSSSDGTFVEAIVPCVRQRA
jgi:ligand-binding sensor domain-containing protein/two-component sensor histidine kinase